MTVKKDVKGLGSFERRILRYIFGAIQDNSK